MTNHRGATATAHADGEFTHRGDPFREVAPRDGTQARALNQNEARSRIGIDHTNGGECAASRGIEPNDLIEACLARDGQRWAGKDGERHRREPGLGGEKCLPPLSAAAPYRPAQSCRAQWNSGKDRLCCAKVEQRDLVPLHAEGEASVAIGHIADLAESRKKVVGGCRLNVTVEQYSAGADLRASRVTGVLRAHIKEAND